MWSALLLAFFFADEAAQDLMRQVAERWESSEPARLSFIYAQRVRSGLLKADGKPSCQEDRRYDVTPMETRTEKKLSSFTRTCEPGHMDSDIVNNVTDHWVDNKDSRDGLSNGQFPLRLQDLDDYTFRLAGEGTVSGRPVRKVTFTPKPHADHPWKGELWIDAEDLQPVRMTTALAHKIPLGVRLFLGTDVKQAGFSASYARVAPGVWFPATYGTEFQIKVLFGYRRTITLSMESSEFRRTDTQSVIDFDPYNTVTCPPVKICANP
jgi:hypothetical protein